jgi:uncharacterized protein YjbI with pentapeptide repeats
MVSRIRFAGDDQQLALLQQAAANADSRVWNNWREEKGVTSPDLEGIDMPGAKLPNVDLSGANLFQANLRGAELQRAKLSRANLTYARLEGAFLDNAEILEAGLEEAQFANAQLPGAILRHSDLTAASFRGANLRGANLGRIEGEDVIFSNADLTGANLEKADLWMANLSGAKLNGSFLRDANLNQARLIGTDLTDVDMIRVRMTGVNLCGASIQRARIYGLSAWDVRTDENTKQRELSIAPPGLADRIMVDDIEVAQFVNLLVDHAKLRKVITAVANKAVLILGRFSLPSRKAFLENLANAARSRGLLPIIYDFERPPEQNWTETVLTLASISLFVIADITDPSSVPLELQATVPNCKVPFVPLHKKGAPIFSMFRNIQEFNWVLPVLQYDEESTPISAFDEFILEPAVELRRRLNARKAEGIAEIDLDAALSKRRQQ